MTSATTRGTLAVHEHCILDPTDPRRSRDPNKRDIRHSHAGGDRAHRHEGTGPGYFPGGIARAKRTVRPNGPQSPTVPLTEAERTFRVVWVDMYTAAHASAGITPERYARERAAFEAIMAGEACWRSASTDQRLIDQFDMLPLYEIVRPDREASDD